MFKLQFFELELQFWNCNFWTEMFFESETLKLYFENASSKKKILNSKSEIVS